MRESTKAEREFWVVLYRYVIAAADKGVTDVQKEFVALKQELERYVQARIAESRKS